MPQEYVNLKLCREMGWTFTELSEQPRFFVEEMIAMLSVEKQMAKRK